MHSIFFLVRTWNGENSHLNSVARVPADKDSDYEEELDRGKVRDVMHP